VQAQALSHEQLDPLFRATVQATEEAIVNAMVAARDMHGTEGHFAPALPHDTLVALLERYGRLAPGHRGTAQGTR
jgi:D-aminopeptidase